MTEVRKLLPRISFLALYLALFAALPVFAQRAAVTVVVTGTSGLQAFGSGFVFDSRGGVLTCYHVVQGASAIRVYYAGRYYNSKVTGIAPSRDFARLQLQDVPLPTQYFPIRPSLPPNITAQQLMVIGFAAGLFDQHIAVKATQNSFVQSQQLKGAKGEVLFATADVSLLPISIPSIFKGMSGSPVIAPDGSVLGILSGSLSEGGSIAWAISAEYADAKYLQEVEAPRPGFYWPPLSLMANGWSTLRRQTGIGEDFLNKIDLFSAVNAKYSIGLSLTCRQVESALLPLNRASALFTTNSWDRLRLTDLDGEPGGAELKRQLNAAMADAEIESQKVRDAMGAVALISDDLLGKGKQMFDAMTDFVRVMPTTAANRRLLPLVSADMTALQQRIVADNTEARRLLGQRALNDQVTVADFRHNLSKLYDYQLGLQRIACTLYPDTVKQFQGEVEVLRRLLAADTVEDVR